MLQKIKRWLRPGHGRSGADVSGPPLSILMVCSGNICRSPSAEGVLRAKLERARITGVTVDSAGTHGFQISEPPDPRAVAAAAKRGYNLSKLRARPVRDNDFEAFDWLVAMDNGHLNWLCERLPAAQVEKARLLLSFTPKPGQTLEVPDPYYGGPAGFERVLDLVEVACDGMVQRILRDRLSR
jgi:protein-tyrosine phosphatase